MKDVDRHRLPFVSFQRGQLKPTQKTWSHAQMGRGFAYTRETGFCRGVLWKFSVLLNLLWSCWLICNIRFSRSGMRPEILYFSGEVPWLVQNSKEHRKLKNGLLVILTKKLWREDPWMQRIGDRPARVSWIGYSYLDFVGWTSVL